LEILDIEKVIVVKYRCDVCNSEDFVIMDTFDYYAGDIQHLKCDICLSGYKLKEKELKKVADKLEELIG